MDPHSFNENSQLRASDADRDQAASVINNAMAEGRLTPDEHSERLDAIYAAKTHAEIAPLLDDLPERGAAAASAAAPTSAEAGHYKRGGRIIAILSGATRKGTWHPEPVIDVLTVLGGAELDFRDAVLPGKEVTVRANTLLGGIEITVPPEMKVIDNGIAILGGREISGSEEAVGPDSPVLRIEGVCVLGGVEVKRRTRKRKGDRSDKGIHVSFGTSGQLEDVLREVRDRRHEVHRQVRAQRREIRDQIRGHRIEIRRSWTEEDDD